MFHKNIDRLNAESDMRQAELMLKVSAGDEKVIQSLFEDLTKKMDRPIRMAPTQEKLDRSALAAVMF